MIEFNYNPPNNPMFEFMYDSPNKPMIKFNYDPPNKPMAKEVTSGAFGKLLKQIKQDEAKLKHKYGYDVTNKHLKSALVDAFDELAHKYGYDVMGKPLMTALDKALAKAIGDVGGP